MTQKNLTVICPNCGKKHKIDDTTKGCGPDTLDGMMAIATVTFSLLTGLGVVVALKCAEWCGAFKSSVELIMAAFVISVAIALSYLMRVMSCGELKLRIPFPLLFHSCVVTVD